jgi:hypothetical protein
MTPPPTRPNLTAAHRAHLTASAISDALIAERGYVSIQGRTDWDQVTHQTPLTRGARMDGLAFPIYHLGRQVYTWVFRPDYPRTRKGTPVKYEYPPQKTNTLDVLPRYQALLGDPQAPIWITEGAKKADAIATAYDMRVVPINLNGVWGWRCTNLAGGKITLPDLDEIAWNGRTVVLAFDSDVIKKHGVMVALQRLARLLSGRGVAKLQTLALPDAPTGKQGVDDFLANGQTTDDLERHLLDLASVSAMARQKLCAHPDTGVDLYLPPGYLCHDLHPAITRVDLRGQPQTIYPDLLLVTAMGHDLETHEQALTVRWRRHDGYGEVTAPRKDLVSGRGARELLAEQGAVVHETNQKYVAEYLSLFAHANERALPVRAHLGRFGLAGGGLLLPAGSVGFAEEVRYSGRLPVRVGSSCVAYTHALRTAATWDGAEAFWLIVALSLASPAIARLTLRRNPTLYTSGDSGVGKTTVNQFAVGAFGDPTKRPLLAQAHDATPVAISQTISLLRGLPLYIDEAHLSARPGDLEKLVYRFANGESRLIGSLDRQTHGGETIGGTLLLAGEAIPEFLHAGAGRRVLWIDGNRTPPLGHDTIGPVGSAAHARGQARAQLLAVGWTESAGVFGKTLYETLLRDWATLTQDYQTLATDQALNTLQAWREPLAVAAACLVVAWELIQAPDPPALGTMLDAWARLLTEGQATRDVATDAWARLCAALVGCEEYSPPLAPSWILLQDRAHGVIGCRQQHDDAWRLLTDTPFLEERIGAHAVQLHGRSWVARGWVRAAKDGKVTTPTKIHGGKLTRCMIVPLAALETWA